MENGDCVRVAVNVRPLITPELLVGCADCVTIVTGEPQVQIGSHSFTYDYVFGNGAIPSSEIFDKCVAPLIEALLQGYNGTVLAYGQTGSGKTYTMGTNYNGEENTGGIIPKVMETIFSRVESMRDTAEFLIRVSFIEIFKEEVFDLLDPNHPAVKAEGLASVKPAVGPSRNPIQIRETVNGGIILAGVTEAEVRTKEEMALYLSRGSLSRATGSTNMNSQSSRSHAIFTISMEQKKIGRYADDAGDDILSAKLHLVDLAGSERAKRTGADGMRFREGIHINKGLLALGNVISALGDEKKRKEGGHVPYRDSKLTRLLQDSLGGNSKTVMIACASPADTNAEETLNTLKYANRARNIQNKAIINRDPIGAQMQRMRSQIEQLQAELLYYRGDSSVGLEELKILKHKISLLEASNSELQHELQERQITCEHLMQRAIDAQVEKDKLILKIEAAQNGKSWDEIESNGDQGLDLVKGYVSRIQELEGSLVHLQNLNAVRLQRLESMKHNGFDDCLDLDDEALHSKNTFFASLNEVSSTSNEKAVAMSGDEHDEKELEHSSLQERLDRELKELDKKLEQKEAEMKRFGNSGTTVLKQHYEKKVLELEQEKKALQKEIEQLRLNLANISSTSDDGAQRLKEEYLQKLTALESQVSELKKKQEAQAQILRQKQKSDEAAKRLQDEIQRIKTQKVQLQNKIKQESEQFRMWKASREKEVLQLKKEGRRNEYEMHKLLALNHRQKMVLQRKAEEAALATKRLKELLESRKAASHEASAALANGPGMQALMQAIEHELEVTVRVHEVRSQYERQMEVRARMAQEVAKLKEEAEMLKQNTLSSTPETMSPGARNSRIFALENMLATSSSTLVSMASQLSEAEERERVFSGRGRWNQVRSLAEAKNLMNHLFDLASSSRCMLRDRELDCRERDSEIKELKEKILRFNGLVRQLEMQKAELIHQLQQKMITKREPSGQVRAYDLRQGPRTSGYFRPAGNHLQLLEDMDTSESEHSLSSDDADDGEWVQSEDKPRTKNSKRGRSGSGSWSSDMDAAGTMKTDTDGMPVPIGQPAQGFCCSCSKYSLCKTMKCECRANGGSCSGLCSCSSAKCKNREGEIKTSNGTEQESLCSEINTATSEVEQNRTLASHGATLLQNALAELHALTELPAAEDEVNRNGRKPLSDIGNTVAKSKAPQPRKKNWRKSTIQLIPVAPPSTQAENTERPIELETRREVDIPLKLPRAMRPATTSNSKLLKDRNADRPKESGVDKDASIPAPRSPVQRAKKLEDKENHDR
ncbi:Kinesin-like protein KIN-4C, variant 3 [Ancistrocladus abbreviatus]